MRQRKICLIIVCLLLISLQGTHFATSIRRMHLVCKSFFFVNSKTGWIVGDDGLFKSKDGGVTWNALNIYLPKPAPGQPISYELNDAYFFNEQVGWVLSRDGRILKTTDSGLSWLDQTPTFLTHRASREQARFDRVRFIDKSHGWILGGIEGSDDVLDLRSAFILKTLDGGLSWTKMELDTAWGFQAFQFLDKKQGWLVHFRSIRQTQDGGQTWIRKFDSGRTTLKSLAFIDTLRGWAIANRNSIFQTTDGGKNWSVKEWGANYTFERIFFLDARTGWIVSGVYNEHGNLEPILLATKNGGKTWDVQYQERRVNLYPFFLNAQEGWLLVSKGGIHYKGHEFRILHTLNGGKSWVPLYPRR